jgi:putative oxidoreductase
MIKRWLSIFLRLLLSAVFLYAAYTKLKQPWLVFAMAIDSYRLLPEWAVLALARTLPWIEAAIGALLLFGIGLRFTAIAASAFLGGFFTVMVFSYSRGNQIDCGCFGLGETLGTATLIRDGLLVAASLTLTWTVCRAGRFRTIGKPS